ncbi:MAG: glycerol-3-phosphate 1-O-acyltransferase PlsY [Myxococcales bacterium]|nr:glycerol-3-phosphate 1-O-acyltransferase PlsY [Myxococcales bacterium]
MRALLLVVAGYLLGSVPFGVIVTRLFAKKDVRASGSGNIGATNVARVAGKKLGAAVLLLDAAKGSAAVALALWLFPQAYALHAGVGFAAFLGHVFPVWLRFQGGKGVATALGVLVVLLPVSALIGFVVWGAIVLITRISSVGSLVGGLLAIVAGFFSGRPIEYAVLGVVLLLAMLGTHRGNIQRLLTRQENKL